MVDVLYDVCWRRQIELDRWLTGSQAVISRIDGEKRDALPLSTKHARQFCTRRNSDRSFIGLLAVSCRK